MTTRVVTAPTVEPITLTEAKLHCRVSISEDDALISSLITVARIYAENYTRRAFCQQTLELTLHSFECHEIQLDRPPVRSIESVKYLDGNGVLTTIAGSLYQVDTNREPAVLKPTYSNSWPVLSRNDYNAVQIRYRAGYDSIGSPSVDDATGVPEAIKHWMKVRISSLYEHREAFITGTIKVDMHRDFVDGLLDPYVVDLF